MTQPFSRRDFLYTVPGACTAAGVFGFGTLGAETARTATSADGQSAKNPVLDGFPRQDRQSVQDVVRFSHFNVDMVKELEAAIKDVVSGL